MNKKILTNYIKKVKNNISLCFIICIILFLCDCKSPYSLIFKDSIPHGKGAISLSINTIDLTRTILPETPEESDIAFYHIDFYSEESDLFYFEERTITHLSEPFYLKPGIYTITISAFIGIDKPIMRGSISNIQINAGCTIVETIILRVIIAAGSEGSFTYILDLPDETDSAIMELIPLNSSNSLIYIEDLLSGESNPVTGTLILNTGYYNVVFTLIKENQKLVWRELLHIYANLDNKFTYTFENEQFYYSGNYIVSFNFNNGNINGEVSVEHGGLVNKPVPDPEKTSSPFLLYQNPPPDRLGYVFDGWFIDNNTFANSWNFTVDVVSSDITLYAKWIGSIDVSTMSGNNDVERAISYVNANVGEYTLFIDDDVEILPQVLNTSDLDLTLIAINNSKLIQINGTGNLFTVNSGVTLTVDNGITLKGPELYNNTSLLRVNSGGTLNIKSGAIITGNYDETEYEEFDISGGSIYLNDGTLIMSGGEISGNTAISGAGVCLSNNSSFTMTGGIIKDNNATIGAGVCLFNSTFIMSGGEISGNSAFSGGGVCLLDNCNFTMSSGMINGNTAALGAGVSSGCIDNDNPIFGTFIMTGGEISGNTAYSDSGYFGNGSGVYVNNCIFILGGTTVIRENTNTEENSDNVYLENGNYITLGIDDSIPMPGMDIWVQTRNANGLIVNSGANGDIKYYFHADEEGKAICLSGDQLIIKNAPVILYESENTVIHDDLVSALNSINSAGTYLIEIYEHQTGLAALEAYNLSLSGLNLTLIAPDNPIIVQLSGTGSIFTVNSGVTLTIDNGVILKGIDDNDASLIEIDRGTFIMNGGEISNNTSPSGGGVMLLRTGSIFTMTGGKICYNNTLEDGSDGGGVNISQGTFTMTGGEICYNNISNNLSNGGGVYVSSAGTFILGGTAVIKENTRADSLPDNVYLSNGRYITLASGDTACTQGMEIWVQTATASGVIVNSGAIINEKNYFHTIETEKAILYSNEKLFIDYASVIVVNEESNEKGFSELLSALNSITTAGTYLVEVIEEKIHYLSSYSMNISNTDITLIAPYNPITIQLSGIGSLFTVNYGVTLTLDNGITLKGVNNNDNSLIKINNGTFTMNNSKISSNTNINQGGGVYINNGIFTMNGTSEIFDMNASDGGGVYIYNGEFILNNGSVFNNKANSIFGGGVYIDFDGIFTMYDGKIYNNEAYYGGGGVALNGIFIMNNGKIICNKSNYGGGIFNGIHEDTAIFEMNGGIISNNTAIDSGGGIVSYGSFILNGNESKISNNIAGNNGGGILIHNGTFTMEGGELNGNTASSRGGGIFLILGSLIINNGKIIYNNAIDGGGGVCALGGIFKINGGEIAYNIASISYGGGVQVANENFFSMTGGVISNNMAGSGGGVWVNNNTSIILGNTAIIKNNRNIDANIDNMYLNENRFIEIGTGEYTPGESMEVWVHTVSSNGIVVNSGAALESQNYFFADISGSNLIKTEDQLILPVVLINDNNGYVSGHANLANALDAIELFDKYSIIMYNNQTLTAKTLDGTGREIKLKAPNSPVTIQLSGSGSIFTVNLSVTLTLEDNITLKGHNDNNDSLVYVKGNLIMNGGSAITGNYSNVDINGGGVYVNPTGSFTMNDDSIISDNEITGSSSLGAGVNVTGGNFIMNGRSKISYNKATKRSGGGVYITSNAVFIMNDYAEISYNEADVVGGGVRIWNNCEFIMNDNSKIINNKVLNGNGGGVHVENFGVFTLNNGTISNNKALKGSGGGVQIQNNGNFIMNNGTISYNEADYGGGVTNRYANSIFKMNGGEIMNNTTVAIGGVFVTDGAKFELGGMAKVRGNNETGYNPSPSNVFLQNSYITLATGINAPISGMEVGINTDDPNRIIIKSSGNSIIAGYFFVDKKDPIIKANFDGVNIKLP